MFDLLAAPCRAVPLEVSEGESEELRAKREQLVRLWTDAPSVGPPGAAPVKEQIATLEVEIERLEAL